MRYSAHRVSNVEDYLALAIGEGKAVAGFRPIWKLHSVVPSATKPHEEMAGLTTVVSWLVILMTDEVVAETERA